MKFISRFKNFYLLIGLTGLIAGCAQSMPSSPSTSSIASRGTVPAELMTPCDALPQFSGNNTNTQDLVGYNISLMQAYGKCSMKLKNLQSWVAGNS